MALSNRINMRGGGGGDSGKTYLSPIGSLIVTSPSNTTASASTKRTFVKNSVTQGITYVNDYRETNVSNLTLSNNELSFRSSSAYGVGLILTSDIEKEATYKVDYVTTGNTRVSVNYYEADGTFHTGPVLDNTQGVFSVPSNAEYVLIVITNQGTSTGTSTFTLNEITKV